RVAVRPRFPARARSDRSPGAPACVFLFWRVGAELRKGTTAVACHAQLHRAARRPDHPRASARPACPRVVRWHARVRSSRAPANARTTPAPCCDAPVQGCVAPWFEPTVRAAHVSCPRCPACHGIDAYLACQVLLLPINLLDWSDRL